MRRLQKTVVAMGLSLFLGGCTSEFPDDLTLIALHAQQPTSGEERRWMNIVLGTKEDFQKYVLDNNYTSGVYAYFCDNKELDARLYTPSIFKEPSGNYVSGVGIIEKSKGNDIKINGYYLFSAFINAYRPKHWYAGFGDKPNEVDGIDLLNAPRDVCIQFRGGSMTGGYRSNVVRIPKERLAEEMAHPTPGGRRLNGE